MSPREWVEAALKKYNEKLEGPVEPPERGRLVLTSLLEVLEDEESAERRESVAARREQLFKEMDEPEDDWDKLLSKVQKDE
jgi:hypothetical protein